MLAWGHLNHDNKPIAWSLPEYARSLPLTTSRIPISINWDYNCLVLSPKDMSEFIRDVKEARLQQINMRISNKGALP